MESLATQILVVFVIRTNLSPFWRSHPSRVLLGTAAAGVALACVLPYTPVAGALGFTALPPAYLLVVAVLVVGYLALVEGAKRMLLTTRDLTHPVPSRAGTARQRVRRRAARFTQFR